MAERKRYIDVKLPILKSEMRVLGTPDELHGKTIKLDLTRKLRGKGLFVKFRIFNKDGILIAVPDRFELSTSYIRRVMRKRTSYVEDSFGARCSDLSCVLKPLLITRKKVSRAVRKNLRNTSKEFLLDYVKERDYIEVCHDLMDGSLQHALLPKLKKIYPLSFCDIRVFETKEISKIDLEKASKLRDGEENNDDSDGGESYYETQYDEVKENNNDSEDDSEDSEEEGSSDEDDSEDSEEEDLNQEESELKEKKD